MGVRGTPMKSLPARRVAITVIVEVASSQCTKDILDVLKEEAVHVTEYSSYGMDGRISTHEAGERSIEILDDRDYG